MGPLWLWLRPFLYPLLGNKTHGDGMPVSSKIKENDHLCSTSTRCFRAPFSPLKNRQVTPSPETCL